MPASLRKAELERISAMGFRIGISKASDATAYEDADENYHARDMLLTHAPNTLSTEEQMIWRCGFRIGYLTRIVERGL